MFHLWILAGDLTFITDENRSKAGGNFQDMRAFTKYKARLIFLASSTTLTTIFIYCMSINFV